MPAEPAHLEVQGLSLDLGTFSLRDIDLVVETGQYDILLGASGCGKSTLLKCILGLHRGHRGKVLLDGRDISDEPPERRRMGYLPQSYTLFPHLDVEHNIRFGLAVRNLTAHEADRHLDHLCDLLDIQSLRTRQADYLSGGERQKVALARALATKPRALLLDEPFSSIDEGNRRRLWFELKNVISEIGITTVHITHSIEEACVMGEKLSVLIDGGLVQTSTSKELLERPASAAVARYLGYRNLFSGRARPHPDGSRVELPGFEIVLGTELPEDQPIEICVRPQDIKVVKQGVPIRGTLARNVFQGTFVRFFPTSDACVAWFQLEGSSRPFDFELRFPLYIKGRHDLQPGKPVSIALHERALVLYRG